MLEVAPGLWHWTARRESIGAAVSSYYLESERVLIDPMIPPEGLEWFEARGAPLWSSGASGGTHNPLGARFQMCFCLCLICEKACAF